MRKAYPLLFPVILIFSALSVSAQEKSPVMSEAYYKAWNDSLQNAIDSNIEKYRKGDAEVILENVKPGSMVTVEQVSSDFLFGSNIFLFDQLDTPEKNQKYKDAFGELFNAATIAFYWKTLEPEKGKIRFTADSPYEYRRPATDPVVEFCESKGISMKGHAIIYGIRSWGHPTWMPEDRKVMEKEFEKHIKDLADHYKDRVQDWDVVNECYDQANRGMMPDDYTFKAFKWAEKYFPPTVKFNTNECDMHWGPTKRYTEIARNLIDRGARVDYAGVQMHIFNPREATQIAEGTDDGRLSPDRLWATMEELKNIERPIFISEVTVSAPEDTPKGLEIQKVLATNLYRLWFSHPSVAGITWWNLVDGGAAPGEPSISGLFDKNMKKKPAYEALDQLINHDWRTNLTFKAPKDGKISWRGFKGNYKITYKDKKGKSVTLDYHVD